MGESNFKSWWEDFLDFILNGLKHFFLFSAPLQVFISGW